jgi:hypothetical protein
VLLNSAKLILSDMSDTTISFQSRVQETGEFRFGNIPEGTYELKVSNGHIFSSPPPFDIPENMPDEMLADMQQQYHLLRTFANTTVAVTVQTTDVEDLAITLADKKLPDRPKQSGVPDQYHMAVPQ